MLTKADLIKSEKNLEKRLEKKFLTKQEFSEFRDSVANQFLAHTGEFKKVRDELREIKQEMKWVKNALIDVVGELKAMREELAAFSYRQAKHDDWLENHEFRLSKLESPSQGQ